MEIRQLKYFVGIAETGNFSETSKNMFISQSAVSQQIKALEDELGMQLFVRKSRNVHLTESGRELLPLAKQVLRFVSDCQDKMSALKGLLCGELNIGLTDSIEPFVRETMLRFMKIYPKVQVNLQYKALPELIKGLNNGEIDLMLSMKPTAPFEDIESLPLLEYRLSAIMRKTHPLANKESVSFHDLEKHSIILPEKGIRERNALESFLNAETGQLNIRSLINNVNAILNILQESNYISILAEHSISNRPNLCSIRIDELNSPIKVFAQFNKNTRKKRSAEIFLEMIKESPALYMIKNF